LTGKYFQHFLHKNVTGDFIKGSPDIAVVTCSCPKTFPDSQKLIAAKQTKNHYICFMRKKDLEYENF